jgi:transcriptional regulator with XRE-family HTH domain
MSASETVRGLWSKASESERFDRNPAAPYIWSDILRAVDAARTLRDARRAAGLTQAQLAARARTSQATLSAYERGRKEPTVATLDRLLRATGRRLATTAVARQPTPAELERVSRQLTDVLDLAAALPTRHEPVLRYPPLRRAA